MTAASHGGRFRIIHSRVRSGLRTDCLIPAWNTKANNRGVMRVRRGKMRFERNISSAATLASGGAGPLDDRAADQALTEEPCATRGVRSSARRTDHREAIDAEMIDQLSDIVGTALQRSTWVMSAVPVSGPIDRDETHTTSRRGPVRSGPKTYLVPGDPCSAITGTPLGLPYSIHASSRPSREHKHRCVGHAPRMPSENAVAPVGGSTTRLLVVATLPLL